MHDVVAAWRVAKRTGRVEGERWELTMGPPPPPPHTHTEGGGKVALPVGSHASCAAADVAHPPVVVRHRVVPHADAVVGEAERVAGGRGVHENVLAPAVGVIGENGRGKFNGSAER